MKRFPLIFFLFFFSLGGWTQSIIFTPQWTPQAQFAGYYVAFDKGFYDEAGVEVDIQHPSTSYSAFNRLLEGRSDIITMQLAQALIKIDCGVPLINILQTSQRSGLMLVSRSDSLRSFDDFRGKKIGAWKVEFGKLAYIMDADMGMNIRWIPFLEGKNLYLSGAIDATLAMSYNEYLQIKVSGYENKPFIRFCETEYDFPEDGVYVTAEFYHKNKDKINAFVQASRKGWEWAHNHPKEALEIVMKWIKKEQVYTNRLHQQWMLEEILRLQCEKGKAMPTFNLNAHIVDRLSELLLKYQHIRKPITLKTLKGE